MQTDLVFVSLDLASMRMPHLILFFRLKYVQLKQDSALSILYDTVNCLGCTVDDFTQN